MYTIGFGTTTPPQPVCNIDQLGGDVPSSGPFDIGPPPGRGSGAGASSEIDEATLQGVANMTGGQYFRAQDADQLDDVFRTLPREVVAAAPPGGADGLVRARGSRCSPRPRSASSLWWNRYP